MTYQETLDFLFTQLPMYQRSGAVSYKKDIGNIIELCEFIDNPHLQFKTIHVGGTNGKGSVSKLLSSVFQEGNHKVGLYTSPHYIDFRERIQVNGQLIEKDFIVDFVKQINPILEELQPSFFEITVALAFSYFAKQKVDIAIIEVGLGGRLDSTNIIKPELSIITNIGTDHQNLLGDSLQEIAGEKAGIIKPLIPVVIGKTQTETTAIFNQKAKEKNAPIVFADQQYTIINETNQAFSIVNIQTNESILIEGAPNGNIQQENIKTAFVAIEELKKVWNLSPIHFKNGVKNIEQNAPLIGRWQIIQQNPNIILDSCHNKEGIQEFFNQLIEQRSGELYLIYGTVSDKKVDHFINYFPKDANYYLTQPSVPRKMELDRLKTYFKSFTSVHTHEDVHVALKEAKIKANPEDTIAIFGSVFLVADALKEASTRIK